MGTLLLIAILLSAMLPTAARSQAAAAMVMDMRSGEVYRADNADTRLHPASLTKMMTLYIVFEAIANGEITLDTPVRISATAAREPPSRLGLRAGQTIALRYLIRAAAIRSANDAATAIAEAISGSEAAFAARMTRTARAMGMTNTTFRNAHGLTADGHLSTARDMTILGRQLFFDYPQYYNIFSRLSAHAGIAEVRNTNARLLQGYRGADGIKTGYTRAAGFNLVASAERNGRRVIVTVFGGRSVAHRTQRVIELLDFGFSRAPARVALQRPPRVPYQGRGGPEAPLIIAGTGAGASGGNRPAAGRVIRLNTAPVRSPRPLPRPTPGGDPEPEVLMAAIREEVADIVARVAAEAGADPDTVAPMLAAAPPVRPQRIVADEEIIEDEEIEIAEIPFGFVDPDDLALIYEVEDSSEEPEDENWEVAALDAAEGAPQAVALADTAAAAPVQEPPAQVAAAPTSPAEPSPSEGASDALVVSVATTAPDEPGEALWSPNEGEPPPPVGGSLAMMTDLQPVPGLVLTLAGDAAAAETALALATPVETGTATATEVVLHLSSQSPRLWHISLGRLQSRDAAERLLMRVALAEASVLDGGLRRIENRSGRFEATYVGLTEQQAYLACARLTARGLACEAMRPR